MKPLSLLLLTISVAVAPWASAGTFYSIRGEKLFPSSPNTWNSSPDGTGFSGLSTTYNDGTNELVISEGSEVYSSRESEDIRWNAKSYLLDGGTLRNRGAFGHFAGGDLTVGEKGFTFAHGASMPRNQVAGGVKGTGNLILESSNIILTSAFADASGIYEFGLPVVGDGKIDLAFSNSSTAFFFSALTPEFTGEIDGTRFEGIIGFAPGEGASEVIVRIGRRNANKLGRLHLAEKFSVRELELAGHKVPEGSFSYKDLVDLFPEAAGCLIDGGGTITVGKPAGN